MQLVRVNEARTMDALAVEEAYVGGDIEAPTERSYGVDNCGVRRRLPFHGLNGWEKGKETNNK